MTTGYGITALIWLVRYAFHKDVNIWKCFGRCGFSEYVNFQKDNKNHKRFGKSFGLVQVWLCVCVLERKRE